ncbi:MAG: hypothetical protein AMXMBFR47_41430 [Planctomycetota bacterium]
MGEMSATPDLRRELESLSIPKSQRPASAARRRSGWGRIFWLLVLAGAGYWGYTQRDMLLAWYAQVSAPATEVAVVTVRAEMPQARSTVLTATGKIVSDHLVSVVTKVSGQIVDLMFEQGDRVERGQVLARIEDVNYRARRDEAEALLKKARAALEYQEFEYARVMALAPEMRATEREVADVKRARDSALAQVAADEAALRWAQKALDDCEVVAPIAGVVLERNVEVGDFVAAEGGRGANANAQFAIIADMSKLRVEVDISELDVARISAGLPCTITPDAYKDRKYTGRVMWIDPGANYAKATVQAKVRIDLPDEFLRVEGSAQVQFLAKKDETAAASAPTTATATPVLWIPASALRPGGDGSGAGEVFVVAEGGVLRIAKVRMGRSSGGDIEVVDGLTAGQTIVARDTGALRDGQRVKVAK